VDTVLSEVCATKNLLSRVRSGKAHRKGKKWNAKPDTIEIQLRRKMYGERDYYGNKFKPVKLQ
jgi:hypothetical protein